MVNFTNYLKEFTHANVVVLCANTPAFTYFLVVGVRS